MLFGFSNSIGCDFKWVAIDKRQMDLFMAKMRNINALVVKLHIVRNSKNVVAYKAFIPICSLSLQRYPHDFQIKQTITTFIILTKVFPAKLPHSCSA